MRKILALLLLAGVSTPALAAADPGDTIRSHANREARQEARSEARSERSGGNDRSSGGGSHSGDRPHFGGNPDGGGSHSGDRPHFGGNPDGGGNGGNGPQPAVQVDSGSHPRIGPRGHAFSGGQPGSNGGERPTIQPTDHSGGASDTVRNWHGPKIVEPSPGSTETRVAPTLRQQDRPLPGVFRNRAPIVSNEPHEGTQPPIRVDNRSRDRNHRWDTSWRNDHRYDWRDWRRHHRSHFHLGFYYDPFGWSYRPYSIGWRLWPNYYSSRYWINDPWEYRLPYAPPGYRWIRYWDDAILVDTFTGEVRDVIPNFFW